MGLLRRAILSLATLLVACQPQATARFAVVDGRQIRILSTTERVPLAIVNSAGLLLGAQDNLLLNGYSVAHDAALPAGSSGTLQILRAAKITLNRKSLETTARTVGEALSGADMPLYAADGFAPSANTVIGGPLAITYTPSRALEVTAGGAVVPIRSAASTVGTALAASGLPLVGLAYSKPGENEALPADGKIQLIRVTESLVLRTKSIPFQSEVRDSSEVELGQQEVLQPGVEGLSVSRVRIRYEDGKEVSRETKASTVVQPPQNRIIANGTKIVLKTATINGVTIQYWRALQMYATVYSPCASGGSQCSSGTASGLPAGKGVVAVDPALYSYLNGQRIFIPGYGRAVIGDIGGGYIIEQNLGVSRYRWLDLGFDDNNLVDMTGWVTVYFLAPAPATIPDILK